MTTHDDFLGDPAWLPHRIDPASRRIQWLQVETARLFEQPFLANLTPDMGFAGRVSEASLLTSSGSGSGIGAYPASPVFIFHTGFCRSTLMAKAMTIEGVSTGLSEPPILNDLAALHPANADLLAPIAELLSRPRADDEAVFIKPSNHANILIPHLMDALPGARAIFLSHSLDAFLKSVHKKSLPGRSWARRLYLEIQAYAPLDLGLNQNELFAMSDLQIAGLAWLLGQRWFALQQSRLPAERYRTLDSSRFDDARVEIIAQALAFAGAKVSRDTAEDVARGPVFARDAKTGVDFSQEQARQAAQTQSAVVADEIDKVGQWIRQIEAQARTPQVEGNALIS